LSVAASPLTHYSNYAIARALSRLVARSIVAESQDQNLTLDVTIESDWRKGEREKGGRAKDGMT